MNPAALRALTEGDMENFLVAATPGGIIAQEQRGQAELVNSSTLPIELKGCTRGQVEAMGIVYGENVDDLFVSVTLPAGWTKQATEHHMWSDLLDDKGCKRASIFYKAAFYDRSAHMHLERCVNVIRRYYDETTETDAAVVSATDGVLFSTARVGRRDWAAVDSIEKEAGAFADTNYPDWRNPAAYW